MSFAKTFRLPSLFLHLLIVAMNVTQGYAIAAGGILVLMFLLQSIPFFQRIFSALAILTARHLTYPFIIRRHRLLGPWSRADVLLQLVYVAMNMLCMTFRVASVKEALGRAGTLAIINLTPSFFAFHLSFLADLLGISLSNIRRIHRMTGWMSCYLGVIHAFATIYYDPPFLRDMPKNRFAVIVSRCTFRPSRTRD